MSWFKNKNKNETRWKSVNGSDSESEDFASVPRSTSNLSAINDSTGRSYVIGSGTYQFGLTRSSHNGNDVDHYETAEQSIRHASGRDVRGGSFRQAHYVNQGGSHDVSRDDPATLALTAGLSGCSLSVEENPRGGHTFRHPEGSRHREQSLNAARDGDRHFFNTPSIAITQQDYGSFGHVEARRENSHWALHAQRQDGVVRADGATVVEGPGSLNLSRVESTIRRDASNFGADGRGRLMRKYNEEAAHRLDPVVPSLSNPGQAQATILSMAISNSEHAAGATEYSYVRHQTTSRVNYNDIANRHASSSSRNSAELNLVPRKGSRDSRSPSPSRRGR